MDRRTALPLIATLPLIRPSKLVYQPFTRVQYSVNAYSFNKELTSGKMKLSDMMDFAANIGLDAVDLTAYYFPSYPDPPSQEELFALKAKALSLGLNISWTGVRNNFVQPDAAARAKDRKHIQQWLDVASQLGASILRIFAGKGSYEGYSKTEVIKWMVEEFRLCAQYAAEEGVIAGLQHHNDFLYTSDEVIQILNQVHSKWFGLILDTGSLRKGDPYQEIQRLAPYANYWFVKEHVYPDGQKMQVDMQRIAGILKEVGYQGYISFEKLSDGDPRKIIEQMYKDFRQAYERQ